MRIPVTHKHHSYVRNGLDHLGLLLGLPRLPGEKNASYRARLEGVFAKPGNSTYQGLLAALSREFNLPVQPAVRISCTANTYRLVLQQQTLSLYLQDELIISWFLREPEVDTVGQLVTAINQLPAFQAVLLDVPAQALSRGLVSLDSHIWVIDESVPAARDFRLQHSPVIPGTIVFDEDKVFQRFSPMPELPGDFFLDINTGRVKTAISPSGQGKVAYQYRQTEIILYHSPIALLDLNSSEARNWFFNSVSQFPYNTPDQRFQPGQPHPFMEEIIQELNLHCPALWGV